MVSRSIVSQGPITKPKGLDSAVHELIAIDSGREFSSASTLLARRRDLRQRVRDALGGQVNIGKPIVKLPTNSNVYVGIKLSERGRVSWKDTAYAIAKKGGISPEVVEQISNKYRGTRIRRLYYGSITDPEYDERAKQLDLFTSGNF